ncbi:MAG: isochorismatase family cysteine hydrolase [Gemmatimonadota bacterium]|nr:isochorismatase family cysteine hydrolase [Gemmatimonadota bacterium]
MSPDSIESLRRTYVTVDSLAQVTRGHLESIAPYNYREVPFRIDESALVIIDMQRYFLEPGYPLYTENGRAIVPTVRLLQQGFRSRSRPVILAAQRNLGKSIDRGAVLSRWWPGTPLEGSPDADIIRELEPLPDEKVISKRRYSAFFATDLELTLRTMGVSQIVVAGLFTNVCVEATVRDAFMRDFLPFIPADACASLNEELHLGALRTMALWYAKILMAQDLLP